MTRRRYWYLNRLSKKLGKDLNNIVVWTRGNRHRKDVLDEALIKAERRINKYFDIIIPYVWRSRVKRDLANPKQLTPSEIDDLRKTCDQYLSDFKGILKDVL